ncbi:MAG TPA: monovalent cation:proton antiporter-2 (CPA2) family protein [Usitatibacter sp.]|nr:monovalent cation:proton antiporter-2 (CPA2) family protein [Usitatibacter sp.]
MEHGNILLTHAMLYLAAAVFAAVAAHRFGLASVAGYLIAGVAIGPFGAGLVGHPEDVRAFAELGVVFLLFVIGLELEPRRLWSMRNQLVGLGLAQVAGCGLLIGTAALMLGADWRLAVVAGAALTLSSTALALQPLSERGSLGSRGGQATFAVLLFQDIAAIPMLALLPLMSVAGGRSTFSWTGLATAALAVSATLTVGHFLARPVFRHIARTRLREVFTAFALLLVLGIALVFEHFGLSMALGAFLAGVLLAESEYRHEIEAAVEPFKGLLLALFFISVGMSMDFGVLMKHPLLIAGIIMGMLALKGAILWLIANKAGIPADERPLFILLLAQGGEFAFVIVGVATANTVVAGDRGAALTLAVALSMLATPFLLLLHDRVLMPRMAVATAPRPAEAPQRASVILVGLGRMGQVVARLLAASGYPPTVLDDDPDHVEQSRQFGFRVFYGDATRLDLLHAAGADEADLLIITLDRAEDITRLAGIAKKHFPNLRIVSRAHDMRHMFELRDLGVEVIERETWLGALKLGEAALALASGEADRAGRLASTFAAHDREVQAKLYEVHLKDPAAQVAVSNELRDQIARTLREESPR